MSAFRYGNRARSKYNAKPTHGFPSKLEYAVYKMLLEREEKGLITSITRQASMTVFEATKKQNRITWKVDFSFFNCQTNQTEYAEAKGVETSDYRIKLKLWRENRTEALEIWKGSWRRPFLYERIENKGK